MSGRVKDAAAKGMLSKQLGGLTGDVAFLDQATGVIKSKKPKKEKTPEQEALAEMKKLQKKLLISKGLLLQITIDLSLFLTRPNP